MTAIMAVHSSDSQLVAIRQHMGGYILAKGIVHRLHELFSVFDRPQVDSLLLCIALP